MKKKNKNNTYNTSYNTFNKFSSLFFLKILLILILIVIFIASLFRHLNPDELEGIHTAWKIIHNGTIYVDFFQHHHPFFYYSLVPILLIFGDSITTIIIARIFIFVQFLIILFLTYHLAKLVTDKKTALLSVVFLCSTKIFIDKIIEIRPDVPQVLFGLFSLLWFFSFYKNKKKKYIILSAVALGLSFLFLQKTIFLIMAFNFLLIYEIWQKKIKWKIFFLFNIVLILTLTPYYLYLFINGNLKNYFIFNWLLNILFISKRSFFYWIPYILYTNFILCIAYFVSLTQLKTHFLKRFAYLSLTLLASIFLVKNAHRQYFLMPIPIITILSAYLFIIILNKNKYLFWSLLSTSVVLPTFLLFIETVNASNIALLQKASYITKLTNPHDYIFDNRNNTKINFFRNDPSFFWFSDYPNAALDTYQKYIDKNYQENTYELIDKYRPKIIILSSLIDPKNKLIIKCYQKSKIYDDILIRKKECRTSF